MSASKSKEKRPTLTFYADSDMRKKITEDARRKDMNTSQWLRKVIRQEFEKCKSSKDGMQTE